MFRKKTRGRTRKEKTVPLPDYAPNAIAEDHYGNNHSLRLTVRQDETGFSIKNKMLSVILIKVHPTFPW